jgi:hypothetical protein
VIVDPDFCDHWKTRMLVGLLDNDEAAPVYILRIWAHCQNRRKSSFEGITHDSLKALCRFPGCAQQLERALIDAGFVRRNNTVLEVCGWDDYNRSLLNSWGNGTKGGRPPRNPRVRKEKPTGSRLDKSREEKIREEKGVKPGAAPFVPPSVEEVAAYCLERVNSIDAESFVAYYAKQGWKLANGLPLKDWKQAIITWEKKDKERGSKSSGPDLLAGLRASRDARLDNDR